MNRKMLAVAGGGCVWRDQFCEPGTVRTVASSLTTNRWSARPPPCSRNGSEALRYEIDGTTIVRFEIGLDGKVIHPAVAQSSGWKILDDVAVHGLSQCLFQANLDQLKGQHRR
jgi:hypothetical protein